MEQSDNNILDGILMAEEDSGQHELDSGRLSRQPSVDVLAGTRRELGFEGAPAPASAEPLVDEHTGGDDEDKRTESRNVGEAEANLARNSGEASLGQGPPGAVDAAAPPQKGWPSKRLPHDTRYFVMKSFSMRDILISLKKGIWATQYRNEAKLNSAYTSCDCVVLFFSVNESRAFQGYAKMASKTGESQEVWTAVDGTQSWGGVFKVKWQTIFDLPFGNTMHLRNPLNENKPVKISRDGQEMDPAVGYDLACLFDEGYAANPEQSLKRRKHVEEPELASKRPRGDRDWGAQQGPRGGPNDRSQQMWGGYGGVAPYGGYGQYGRSGGYGNDRYGGGGGKGGGGFVNGYGGRDGVGRGEQGRELAGEARGKQGEDEGLDECFDITNMTYEEYLAKVNSRKQGSQAQSAGEGGGNGGGGPTGGVMNGGYGQGYGRGQGMCNGQWMGNEQQMMVAQMAWGGGGFGGGDMGMASFGGYGGGRRF